MLWEWGWGGLRKFLNIWPVLVLSERKRSLNLRICVSCDQCGSFDHSLVILSRLMMEFLMVLFSSDSFAFRNAFTERFISVMKLLVGSQSLFLRFHEAFTFWKKNELTVSFMSKWLNKNVIGLRIDKFSYVLNALRFEKKMES